MGERRGTKALEVWCRRMTEGYPGVKVENMTTSWRDGLAFCAMIHHFRPDLIDFGSLRKDDIYRNNELAFRTAERHLGIPALLDAEDMVEYAVPDRLSILTYLSQFYQVFGSQGASPTRLTPKRPATVVATPTSSSPPSKMVAMRSGSVGGVIRREPCKKCSLPVFLAERLNVNNYLYHRTCFRCARCSHQLSLANYYETEQGEYCCETCPDEVISNPHTGDETIQVTKSLSDDEKVTKAVALSDDEFDNLYALEEAKLVTKARSYFLESQFGKDMEEPELEEEEPPPELPSTKPPEIIEAIHNFIAETPDLDILLTQTETSEALNETANDDTPDLKVLLDSYEVQKEVIPAVTEESEAVETVTDNVNTPSIKELVDKQPLANLESNIVTKDKDEVNSVNEEVTHKTETINEEIKEDYPEDLNPFGSDDEEKVPTTSTNPFDSDDEDEVPLEKPAKRESLNPFGSDDEDDLIHEAVNATITKRPIPKPRTLNPETLRTPEPSPRKQFGSTTSLESSISGKSAQTPTGTYRKKKPAPPPPMAKDIFGETTPSPVKYSTTPGGTVRMRKSRPAPAPPTKILVEAPVEAQNDVLIAQVNDVEYEKSSKDEQNRNRQSLSSFKTSASSHSSDGLSDLITPLSPDKSTYGKWKRKKGPAPPRPLPQRRQINILSPDELRQQLDVIEIQQQGLEKQGVKLEQIIRERCEVPGTDEESPISIEVEDLVLQLFELVNEKNELFRKQAELMYLRRQQRLEEEHADLEYQIRCLMDRPERNKTDYDKAREEELINRLIEVVERRNEIVECLEMDRLREAEEDKSISTHLNLLAAKRDEDLNSSTETGKLSKKEKKKQKKIKKNKDVDKDVDETESCAKKEKKKKWLFKIPG